MRHAVTVGSKNAGFSMMELMVALMILTVAITGLLATIIPASRLMMVNRETTIAMTSAMAMIEYMSNPNLFPDLFVLYNMKEGDDPWGVPGTAPGQEFEVPGLRPRDDDPGSMVGKIHFPTYCTTPGDVETQELREDILDPEYVEVGADAMFGMPRDLGEMFGMPRDLGDWDGGVDPGVIDSDDHAGDYYLLPVIIRLEWSGIAGTRSLMMYALIAER